MASKSKRRRRVFRASCILAALIIAGSSFAWFTSKDEVTNRLSASTDYGVSIVESFVPPKQWVPGQTINKDVYAVNTGNIDAFVKESISGNLTYTYEKRVETAPTNADDAGYVRLDTDSVRVIDGATTHEAGGYLAWSNARTPVTTTITIDDATFTTDEEKAGYVDGKDETFVKLVNGGTSYWIKKSDLDTKGDKTLYTGTGTPSTPAVEAQDATDSGKTLEAAPISSKVTIEGVEYTISTTATPGYDGGNANFYALTAEGATEPAYYVKGTNSPNAGDKLYTDAGTRAADAIPGTPATPAGKTAKVEKGGNAVSIVPGPVNSATLTDAAESANGTDSPGAVVGTRWHPEDTGVYIFRRSFTPAAKSEDGKDRFTYAGYYYVASDEDDNPNTPEDESEGKYYKIVLGSDDFRAIEGTGTGTDKSYIFDVSATQEQLGYPTMIEIDPVTGAITGDVAYSFVKEVEVKDVTPDLVYHANGGGTDDVAYLQAIYSANDSEAAGNFLQKQAIATAAAADADAKRRDYLDKVGIQAAKEAEYENTVGEYNSKKSRYDQAVADWEYAKALSEASKKLSDAAKARAAVQTKVDSAKDDLDDAYNGLKNMADDMYGDDTGNYTSTDPDAAGTEVFEDLLHFADSDGTTDRTNISYNTLFQTEVADSTTTDPETLEDIIKSTDNVGAQGNTANHFNNSQYELLRDAHQYMDAMNTLWDDSNGGTATDASIVGASARLEAALADFATLSITGTTSADAEAQAKFEELTAARDNMKSLLEDYKKLYQSLRTVNFTEGTLTALTEGTDAEDFETNIGDWIARLDDMKNFMEKNTDPATAAGDLTYDPHDTGAKVQEDVGLNLVVDDFKKKYEDYYKANTKELPAAEKAWEQALRTYNSEVGNTADGAQGKYYAAIDKDQRVIDPYHSDKDSMGNYSDPTKITYQKNDYEGLVKDRNNTALDSAEATEWHLTNNNNDLVSWFAIEGSNAGSPTIDAFNADDEITDDGKNLWQTIGRGAVGLPTGTAGTNRGAGDYTFYPAVVDGSDPAVDVAATAEATYDTTDAAGHAYTRSYIAMATTDDFYTLVSQTNETDDTKKFKTVSALKTAYESVDVTTPETAYAQAIADTAAAKKASDRAATVSENAEAAANEAMAADASAIKINILLDDDAANLDWTSALADGDSAKVAEFYYNYVLGAGQTSEKLIDAVELDPSLTARDYKELVFDLNVKLDSAQVTYADDQRTITTEAVSTPPFNMTATVGEETAKGVKVTWDGSTSVSPTTIYRVGTDPVTPKACDDDVTKKTVAEADATPASLAGEYGYYIVKGSDTYYGKKLADGEKFYKIGDDNKITAATETITLNIVE